MRPGFWRTCRVCFRWCRVSLLVLVLAVVSVLFWFNQVGLPDFLKQPLLASLRDRGILVQFTRMRLRMTRGIVVENIRAGAAADPQSPTLTIADAQILLDFPELFHGRLRVQGVILREGRLVIPFNETNQPLETLELDHIQTDLRFKDQDTWALDNFQADFKNTKLALSGDLAHAPEIRNWEIFNRKKARPKTGENWSAELRHWSEVLGKIHLAGTPRLTLNIEGDARDLQSFSTRLQVSAPAVQTPWFGARNLEFTATLTARAQPAATPPLPGAWTNAQPFQLVWNARVTSLHTENLRAEAVAADGFWRAPELAINHLSATLGQGRLAASLYFDAARQTATFTNASDFDLRLIQPFLPAVTRQRLALLTFTTPPALHISGNVDLSARPHPPEVSVAGDIAVANFLASGVPIDELQAHVNYGHQVWQVTDLSVARGETRLQLAGAEDDGTKIFSLRAQGQFDANQVRPFLKSPKAIHEVGQLAFHEPLYLDVTVHGQIHDPASLGAEGQLALTNFSTRGGPVDSLVARITYTNRILSFFQLQAWRQHGAQPITADAVILDLPADRIEFKNGFCTTEPMFIGNTIGPKTGRILAPYQFLAPPTARVNGYVSLHSSDEHGEMVKEDLQVTIVKGGPFRWEQFNSRNVSGFVHWLGPSLELSDMNLEFYQGRGVGVAHFAFHPESDFHPDNGTDFSFNLTVTNVNLHWLMADLSSPTNRLEGLIGGQLIVTSGNSTNWQLMNGYGDASLHDGLIWDAPLFGVLSPALNRLMPGLGSSRATDAAASFTMTNGVIYSDSLEIHTTKMRLHYDGTVDLKQNINARATAQILRDTPGLGQLISIISWPVTRLFEVKVTGTLSNPTVDAYHDISKLLLAPLHPIKTLENILPAGNTNSTTITNAPARR